MKVEPFDTQRHLTFTRRATLAAGGVFVLFGGISARLYDLQVRRYEEFLAKADDNRFKQRVVVPLRGEIIDRYGNAIATSRQNFRVLLIPEKTSDVAASIAELEEVLPLTTAQRDRLLREIANSKNTPFIPVQVVEDLEWDAFSAVNFHRPHLEGIVPEVGKMRFYPAGESVAPIVGHVGTADVKDLERASDEIERVLFRQPGFKIGKLGLESTHDAKLRGAAGTRFDEIDASGRIIGAGSESGRARQGDRLALTIDLELQQKAHEILSTDYEEYPEGTEGPGAISGAAVVIDTETGDIIVMASTPSFDPNIFALGADSRTLRSLETSPLKPMWCKPLRGAYPPGSTFKLLTAIAAQEQGISPSTRFHCSGGMPYGGRRFNCWKREGHGSVDMRGAIKHSCDVYFYQLATRVDIDAIADVAERFGLGQTYDLGIAGEVSGTVPSRAWKRDYYRTQPENQIWFPGETLSVAIGQGAVTSTPLQLAVMSARLATGRKVTPRILRGAGDELYPLPAFPELYAEGEMLDAVREGMDQVVNEWGTAARSSLMPDYRMAGKTGTSQIRALQVNPKTGRPFQNHELPWAQRDHALFVAFAPLDSPRYACAVVIEHGGSGSRSAGPRARDLMKAVLDKDPADRTKHPLWRPGQEDRDERVAFRLDQEG